MLLVLSVTVHNLPEGLAIGVAFGAFAQACRATLVGAMMLAMGIGIQNFPEGTAVAMPLLQGGMSCGRAFFLGAAFLAVEPAAGVAVRCSSA